MSAEQSLIVSVSGIRGIVGESLTPAAALAFASALGGHADGGAIVVGRDGRPSGIMLRHAILAGLTAAGCEVHDLGVAPTPTVGLAVRHLHAAGGIQITASHNPAPWNGLKLFGPDGRVLSAAEGRKVQARFELGQGRRVSWNALGTVRDYHQAEDLHCNRILELVDAPRIRAAGLRAFLDANGGAGGPLGRRLLQALHVETTCRGGDADGRFLHEPEPTADNLRDICPLVVEHRADIGFALDPDSDRLALIDETGRYIGEELTLALAVSFRLRQRAGAVGHQHVHVARQRRHRGQARLRLSSLGGRRGQRGGQNARSRRPARRRRQRRRPRSARRSGARSVHRHGPGTQPDGGERP